MLLGWELSLIVPARLAGVLLVSVIFLVGLKVRQVMLLSARRSRVESICRMDVLIGNLSV